MTASKTPWWERKPDPGLKKINADDQLMRLLAEVMPGRSKSLQMSDGTEYVLIMREDLDMLMERAGYALRKEED